MTSNVCVTGWDDNINAHLHGFFIGRFFIFRANQGLILATGFLYSS
jgi:hypothetical protein